MSATATDPRQAAAPEEANSGGDRELLPGPFISYSRADRAFARRLHDALQARKRDAWVDLEGIEPSEDWLKKLYSAIDAAQAFVFVISERSIASTHCADELRHATESNKKLLPVLQRHVEDASLPEVIRKLQWISFLDSDPFDERVDELVRALDTDLEWTSAHTRLLVRAKEWERAQRDRSRLLRGQDLKGAEQWLLDSARQRDRQPAPVQSEFIGASVRAERRARNRLLGAVAAAAVLAIALAVTALYQREQARRNEQRALSRQLAAQSIGLGEQNLRLAMLLAVTAFGRSPTREANHALGAAMRARPHLQKYLDGQRGPIAHLVFDSGGVLLGSSSKDGTVLVWDSTTGRSGLRVNEPPGDTPSPIALSGKAKLLFTARKDGAVQFRDLASGTPVASAAPSRAGAVRALAATSDGRLMARAGVDGGEIWEVPSNRQRCATAPGAERLLSLAFSEDGTRLAAVSASGASTIFDAANCAPRAPAVSATERGASFSAIAADLERTASVTFGPPKVLLTDMELGKAELVAVKGTGGFLLSLAFRPHGGEIAFGTQGGSVVIQSGDRRAPRILEGHTGDVTSIAFDPSGRRLASGSAQGEVIIRDLELSTPIEPARSLPEKDAESLFAASSAHELFAVSKEGAVRRWNTQSRKAVALLPARLGATKTTLSPRGSYVAGIVKSEIVVWRVADGSKLAAIPVRYPNHFELAFSSDENSLGFADDHKAVLWDLAKGTRRTFDASSQADVALAFLPRTGRFAFMTKRETLALVDRRSGKQTELRLEGTRSYVRTIAASPDETVLAVGGGMYDGDIRLLSLTSGKQLRTLMIGRSMDVSQLAFSPDGSTLASVTAFDETLRLWDVATGQLIRGPDRLAAAVDNPRRIAFAADGSFLASLEQDSIVISDLAPESWVRALCASANRNLTRDEWSNYVGSYDYEPSCPGLPIP